MPDPLRKTISATEVSALFDANPYCTRWMLYRRFAHGEEQYTPSHVRMDWGTKLEPLILDQAAHELKLEVRPNKGEDGKQVYIRNGILGCTRDADIICPDRGPGTLEIKSVFEYPIWMQEWGGGRAVPRHIEIQVQAQMRVGDGTNPYKWGIIAVWIAGDIVYFKREPVLKFWEEMDRQVEEFFTAVRGRNEPEPFGAPMELPLLAEAFPIRELSILDLREAPEAMKIAEDVRMLDYHCKQKSGHEKAEKKLKARLRGTIKDHEKLLLPNGINVTQKKVKRAGYEVEASEYITIKPYVPEDLRGGEL